MALKLMYITNNPDVALIAEKHGVSRIWIDLEVLGKEKRQFGLDTVKSQHSPKDVKSISDVVTVSEVMVRVNPWNPNSKSEIDTVIANGADIVMLPMWKKVAEVDEFIKTVGGRAKTSLLLETNEAECCLDKVLELSGIDEIHIGLNDLHLSKGMKFMFQLLSDGTVENICNKIKKAGIPYGFGGIARIGEGMLPAEKIIAEHYRLKSTRAILSRSFCNCEQIQKLQEIDRIFSENMKKLHDYEESLKEKNQEFYMANRIEVEKIIKDIVGE